MFSGIFTEGEKHIGPQHLSDVENLHTLTLKQALDAATNNARQYRVSYEPQDFRR